MFSHSKSRWSTRSFAAQASSVAACAVVWPFEADIGIRVEVGLGAGGCWTITALADRSLMSRSGAAGTVVDPDVAQFRDMRDELLVDRRHRLEGVHHPLRPELRQHDHVGSD